MAEKKRCIRCDRPIDAAARICPYCNWDQTNANLPRPEESAAPVYVPHAEVPWRRYVAIGIGAVVLVIVAFALGSHVIGSAAAPPASVTDTAKTSTDNTGPVKPAPHPEITLVPSNDTSGAAPAAEAPITSAPAAPTATNGTTDQAQRTDATAVSSAEYAQLAAREQAEKKKSQPLVNPLTLTGPAYQQSQQAKQQQPPRPAPPMAQPQISSSTEPAAPPQAAARAVTRTPPEPQYQPMPNVQVNETTTVRLNLTVGADGRVKEVDIGGSGIEGQTSNIIATVQTWRFKPATENGMPVQSTFSTALSFHGPQ